MTELDPTPTDARARIEAELADPVLAAYGSDAFVVLDVGDVRTILDDPWATIPHEVMCRCGATGSGDCRVTDVELRTVSELAVRVETLTHQRDRLRALVKRMRRLGYSPTNPKEKS